MVFLSFLPLIVFPIVSGFLSVRSGIFAALAASIIVVSIDRQLSGGSVKILNLGGFVVFAILAVIDAIFNPVWNDLWVRLAINSSFFGIVLWGIVVRQPFTLQYARRQVPKELWASPIFLQTNDRITAAWAAAFLVGVIVDLVRIFVSGVPPWLDSTLVIGSLVIAGWFTSWYPKHVRAKYARTAAT